MNLIHHVPGLSLVPCLVFGLALEESAAAAQQLPTCNVSVDQTSRSSALGEASVHSAVAIPNGFEARNPGQEWRLVFDGLGVLVEPENHDWGWGLQLASYGFAGCEVEVVGEACARVGADRVSYQWDDLVEEWYVNDERGLEHGFTVRSKPSMKNAGPLRFTLRGRGGLTPRLDEDGHGIRFLDPSGRAALNYSGLTVFDADDRVLPAWFEAHELGFTICVDERDARYPLTVDPVAQETYLKASNTGVGDGFGWATAISGDTLVVCAPEEDSDSIGVNGDQLSDRAAGAGAAYVFVRSDSTWVQQAYLKASNAESGDKFGFSVSIADDTIVVGAYQEDGEVPLVPGAEANNDALGSGAAYVFNRSGTTWSQSATLKASNAGVGDAFGYAVAIHGDTIAIGAIGEDSNAVGVDADQDGNSASSSGAVYLFERAGLTWGQDAYIKASNADGSDRFGCSVDLSTSFLVVGATGEGSSTTGVNGDQTNDDYASAGAAYVFARSGSSWIQEAYLKASNSFPDYQFGGSVSVSAATVVVGSQWEQSLSQGINGSQAHAITSPVGAAYVFAKSGTVWNQEAYLKASNAAGSYLFGGDLVIAGDVLVVGSSNDSSCSRGIDPDQSICTGGTFSGSTYVFRRNGTMWSQDSYLKASNAAAFDGFGVSLGYSAGTLVVGAPQEDSDATGVGGDSLNDLARGAGAAYVFNLECGPPPPVDLCSGDGGNQSGCTNCPCGNNTTIGTIGGCLNSVGNSARLFASGDASVSLPVGDLTDLRFALTGAPPSALCILVSGGAVAPLNQSNPCFSLQSGLQASKFDGLRCAVADVRRHGSRASDPSGAVGQIGAAWGGSDGPPAGIANAGFLGGETRFFQAIHRENSMLSCMRGLNTSQAVKIVFIP